ncbi:MAG TPA: filamentous hemagglutinin N-terminal domain-containing protein [Chroococcales cyanobacterium]
MAQQTEDLSSESKLLNRVRGLAIGDALKKLSLCFAIKKAKEGCVLLLLFGASLVPDRAFAQLTPDTTLDSERSVVTPGVLINNQSADRIDGGASRGTNLFHSFLEFNLTDGQRVYFASPTGIDTIITRVTGTNPSTILGTLGVNGSADLFLINPNGILFGPNARLDVSGSFFASTASSVVFADGIQFSATTPQNSPLLSISVPLGVQFGATPGSVQVQGSKLEVPPGKTLGLVGGAVTLQGGTVAAPSGRVELGSVAGNSVVSLHSGGNNWSLGYEGVQNFQDIQLSKGAVVSASGEGGGDIQVWARSLQLSEASRLEALTLGSQPGGNIAINASNSVELTGTGTYTKDILLFLAGQIKPSQLRNGLFTLSYGSGTAGDVEINTPSFIARNGAIVATSTASSGHGGDLTVNAEDNVEVTASALITGSGLDDSGDSGDLTVNTGRLLVQNYGLLGTSTLGNGQGGDMRVNASQSVDLIGTNPIEILPGFRFLTGLFSSTPAAGDAGDIEVTTPRLSVRDGAAIGASTAGEGKGGSIRVTASERVELSGKSPDGLAQSAVAATAETGSSGQGGNLSVQTGQLILQDEGRLSVRSRGTGDAGNLEVVADSIQLDDRGSIAAATTVAGEGGNINLQTQSLQLRGGSIINAEGGERGNGGNITIDTDILLALENSNITASAFQGAGGSIKISTRGVFVDSTSKITASSTLGISGVVDINTQINNVPISLLPLEDQLVSREQAIADSCLGRRNAKAGSFTVTGAGGLPSTPYGAFSTPYPVTGLQSISGERTADRAASKVTAEELSQRSSVLQEAQGWYVRPDGRVVLGTIPQLQALAKAEDLVCFENRD